MSLLLANSIVEDLTDVELEKHIQFCHRALVARTPVPAHHPDELEPRRTWPSPDTLPADPVEEDGA